VVQLKILGGAFAIGAVRLMFRIVSRLASPKRRPARGPDGLPDTKGKDYVVTTEEQQNELKAFKCENCGYELYPARGREGKFFPATFKCPMCSSPKESFYDMNDKNDPRNWEDEEEGL
jgi:rubredoxin